MSLASERFYRRRTTTTSTIFFHCYDLQPKSAFTPDKLSCACYQNKSTLRTARNFPHLRALPRPRHPRPRPLPRRPFPRLLPHHRPRASNRKSESLVPSLATPPASKPLLKTAASGTSGAIIPTSSTSAALRNSRGATRSIPLSGTPRVRRVRCVMTAEVLPSTSKPSLGLVSITHTRRASTPSVTS